MSTATTAQGWDRLEDWSRRQPTSPALLAPGGRRPLTWGELPTCLAELAGAIRTTGVTAASRIALVAPPGAEGAMLALAAMRCGVVVPLNPELTAFEMAAALERIRPHLLIFRSGLPGRPEETARALGVPVMETLWGADDTIGWPRLTSASGAALPVRPDDALTAPAGTRLILQTSGTTAQPKLVPLTETNLFAATDALIGSLRLTEQDRGLNLLSQFHIGGLWDLIAAPLLSGGSVICGGLFSTAAFDAGCALEPTWAQLAPSMLRAVVEARGPDATTPRSLRLIRSVSAPLPAPLKDRAVAALGVPVVEIYGMTETAGVITSNPLDPAHQKIGSVGIAVGPRITLRSASGEAVATGQDGEVVLTGPQVSPGYIGAPPSDAAVFAPDGFHTGDLGRLDQDGSLWLVGRVKDLINRGGEMIGPAEIEAAILSLDWIADTAVFGAAHPTLGEEIEAAIVPSPDASADVVEATRNALRPLLGHGRMPARLHVIDAIPRTAGGKLQRHRLVERFASAAPVVAPDRTGQVWPSAPLARWIAEVWAGVLKLDVMGGQEDFFTCGGSSLQAAQAATLIQDRCPGQILYVSSVYEAPTPELQAAFLLDHYPELVARVLGEQMKPRGPEAFVTAEVEARFAQAVVDPLGPAPASPARNPSAVFILSPPRSGSTLLRAMMAGHPALFAPPELYLLSHTDLTARRDWYGPAHASQLEGLPRAFMAAGGLGADEAAQLVADMEAEGAPATEVYRRLQGLIGDRRLVDKTPFYGVYPRVLAAAEAVFEQPLYVHLSRHPYGMIRSFDEARLGQLWWPRLAGPDARVPCPFTSTQLAELIWRRVHGVALEFLAGVPDSRHVHIRYEDLVRAPEQTCRRLCERLDLEFDPAMLDPLGDAAGRMTDGLRPGSRMIGDPKFHRHTGIDATGAERWRESYDADFLAESTWSTTERLGHPERIEAEDRIVFEV